MEAKDNTSFSLESASAALEIARLPNIYEKAYFAAGRDHEAAMSAVSEATPRHMDQINIINIDSTTVIMTYDAQTNSATIAFDPTQSFGDKWDNFRRGHTDHSLGGEVHKGLYKDIARDFKATEQFPAENMTELMGAVLHSYAAENENAPLSVNFAGFSKGGAQTAMAAAEMISEGFFENNPNIKLDNVFTFGPPAYADQEFNDTLKSKTEELGGDVWMVQLHGDTMPKVLSPEGRGFAKYDYGHAGDHVYITPPSEGQEQQIFINPDQQALDGIEMAAPDRKEVHTLDAYGAALQNSSSTSENTTPEIKIDGTQTLGR